MPELLALPAELVIAIVTELRCDEIKQMCETCHWLYDVCISELYRAVDLSSHNSDTKCDGIYYHGGFQVAADYLARNPIRLDYIVFQKQRSFIAALKGKPSFGSLVYELHWTVLQLPDFHILEDEDLELPEEVRNFKLKWELEETRDAGPHGGALWPTFQKLVNVTDVDICWLHDERDLIVPNHVFPKAVSVRLSGCTTRNVVECVLSQSIKSLERIELNNVLQWPDSKPPLPDIRSYEKWKLYWATNKSKHEVIKYSDRLTGALNNLVGKCTALTSLCIATVGLHEEFSDRVWDDECYSEWVKFLDSVRHQLRYFSFKQGLCRSRSERRYGGCRGYRPAQDDHRPMDRLFRQWILPALLQASWPQMCGMEIKGVGRRAHKRSRERLPTEAERAEPGVLYNIKPSEYFPGEYEVTITRIAFHLSEQEELRRLLPEQAELVVDEEAERDYEANENPDMGIHFEEGIHGDSSSSENYASERD